MSSQMSINLMYRDKKFDPAATTSPLQGTLTADLQVERILDAMSGGVKSIYNACLAALFTPLTSAEEIEYRQDVLADARRNPDVIEKMFEIADAAANRHNEEFRTMHSSHISVMYHNTIAYLRATLDSLSSLRRTVVKDKAGFQTEAFRNLCEMINRELSDSYLKPLDKQLHDLYSGDDALISASLGDVLQGTDFKTRKLKFHGITNNWLTAPVYSIPEGSVTYHTEKSELNLRTDLAMDDLTVALRQSAEYVGSFFEQLRNELAFYLGCLNLEDILSAAGMPLCIPTFLPMDSTKHVWRGLYDVSLSIARKDKVVGCNLDIEGKRLFIITGANQGGKSTYLRAIGQAFLMSQCGMSVGAESFNSAIRRNLFTHFKKEEDERMKSGKLDEELGRLSEISNYLGKGDVVMLNESFSSTNEREGSEICRQVTQAMIENGVEVYSVSHMYVYSTAFNGRDDTLHLRAQRMDDGRRTFMIEPGEPLVTAFGGDLYLQVFGKELA